MYNLVNKGLLLERFQLGFDHSALAKQFSVSKFFLYFIVQLHAWTIRLEGLNKAKTLTERHTQFPCNCTVQ